jgi:hypothetical protein
VYVSQISDVCCAVQRKLSASPLSSPPTPGTTVIKKEKKKKKKKRELEESQETEVVEGEVGVCMPCF